MSLTFTDWENCTDDGTGQVLWLNWTADTGLGLYTHLEAIRQAIAERYAAAGLTLTGVLASPLAVGSVALYSIGTAIDSAITALIPAYANHLDNGGNWHGQTVCAPAWTEATILAAIGAASRITVGTLGTPLSAAWARQVYALLGMMGWALGYRDGFGYAHGFVISFAISEKYVEYNSCPGWTELENLWTAFGSIWSSSFETLLPPHSSSILRSSGLSFMRRIRTTASGVGTAKNKTIQAYCRLVAYPSTNFIPDTWYSSLTAGLYYSVPSMDISTADASFTIGTATDGEHYPVHGSGIDASYGFSAFFPSGYPMVLISKNNIPGGFTFQ